MKFPLVIIFFLTLTLNIFGQNSDKTYLYHGHNYSTTYSYGVTELTIHSDSTYTMKYYDLNSKKELRDYMEFEPIVHQGKVRKIGLIHQLNEYRNGKKTDYTRDIKITDRRILSYYENEKGRRKVGAKYKRI